MSPNQPDYPLANNDAPQNVNNPLAVMQPGERVICEIRRHPIGLFGVYSVAALVIAVVISGAILSSVYVPTLVAGQTMGLLLVAGLLIVLTLIFAYIGVFVYQANRWIVTSDSITEDTRTSLFNTESEQLSLANLEDVSVNQDGLIEQLLDYGTLRVESAGERSKFIFHFCPAPKEYARKIIAAHEEFIATQERQMHIANMPLNAGSAYNQPYTGTPPTQPPAAV